MWVQAQTPMGSPMTIPTWLSYPRIQPSPTPTLDYLGPPWTTLDPLTSVLPQITQITRTIRSLRLSMTLYRLPHLNSIVSLPSHSLTSTCTRLTLRDPVLTPPGPSGTAPHSFLQILYLAGAQTGTFSKCAAFSLQPLPLYYMYYINPDFVALVL